MFHTGTSSNITIVLNETRMSNINNRNMTMDWKCAKLFQLVVLKAEV